MQGGKDGKGGRKNEGREMRGGGGGRVRGGKAKEKEEKEGGR